MLSISAFVDFPNVYSGVPLCYSVTWFPRILIVEDQLMKKVLRMLLRSSMRMMNVLGQVYGWGIASFTTTLLRSSTIVLEARYSSCIFIFSKIQSSL